MSKMSYEEAKMLCEKAQEKSSLASSILKKYREKLMKRYSRVKIINM